jgi:hypothetical protein
MGLEATSWDWMSAGVKKQLPHFALMERVENGVLVGMADVNYVIRGVEGWIELKAVELPKRQGTPVLGPKQGLNKEQINWHLKRAQVLGKTWVFVTAAPYRWLVNGFHSREVNQWTCDDFCMKSRYWYDEKWGTSQWQSFVTILGQQPMSSL